MMTDLPSITCNECNELLEEFALEVLPHFANEQVAQHLADGCDACNIRLATIVAELAAVAHTAPPRLPPLQIEQNLMRRVSSQPFTLVSLDVENELRDVTVPFGKSNVRTSVYRSSAVTLAAATLLACIFAWWLWRNSVGNVSNALVRETSEYHDKLQRRVESARATDPLATKPPLQFVSLRQPVSEEPVFGYLAIDDRARQGHVYVFNLPPAPPERRYQFWFVLQNDQFLPAGLVDVDSSGAANRLLDFPEAISTVEAIAVSDEPNSGSTEPSGQNLFRADIP